MEIGSYYNFSPNHLDKKMIFISGRNAIKFILNKLDIKKCLIPNYLCKSIYECFDYFDFYEINNDMTINLKSIEQMIYNNNYDLILIINYFGYIDKSLSIIKEICLINNIIILEDFTHNLFSDNLYGDICISSFRKTLSTPYGALVVVRNKNLYLKQKATINISYIIINCIKILSMGLKNFGNTFKCVWYPLLNFCENNIDYINYDGFDYINYIFYKYYYIPENKLQRIDNTNYIHNNLLLKTSDKFTNTYFCYPIFCKDKRERDNLRNILINKKIYCPIYWQLNFDKNNKCNHNISDRILAIPIDQRYNIDEMTYIIKHFNAIYSD